METIVTFKDAALQWTWNFLCEVGKKLERRAEGKLAQQLLRLNYWMPWLGWQSDMPQTYCTAKLQTIFLRHRIELWSCFRNPYPTWWSWTRRKSSRDWQQWRLHIRYGFLSQSSGNMIWSWGLLLSVWQGGLLFALRFFIPAPNHKKKGPFQRLQAMWT